MPLIAHMTKLQGVNRMLWSIGESPVNALGSSLAEASDAEAILDDVLREVLADGWYCNTERGVEITTDANDEFVIGVDVLSIDTVNASSYRKTRTPRMSGHIEVVVRRNEDDTGFRLYDIQNDSLQWTDLDTLTVDIVRMLEFANLPPLLQTFVWTKAARRFQAGHMGSQVRHTFTQEEEAIAQANAENEDERLRDGSLYNTNPHLYNVTNRYNPLRG